MTTTKYQRVFDYANPHESDAYAMDDAGHGWDRLASIAGEYERGEISWEQAKQACRDNARDLDQRWQQHQRALEGEGKQ